jgi:hypothetical protein
MYVAAPWKTEDIPLVQYAAETGRDRMVFVHPLYEPQVLTRDPTTKVWALTPIHTVGWTVPLSASSGHTAVEWGGVSGANNYPSVVEYWQGRLWMAATPAKKNTFWASKPYTYDFTAADYLAINAGDGFSYDAAVKGEIRWLQGQKVMLCGTDDGEFSFSAGDGVVYAGNINIKQESAYGSAKMQALMVGDQVLFVSPDRKKLRALSFSLEGGGWFAKDITFTAQHLTNSPIVDLCYARDPFSTIVLCLEDGSLACCNYDRAEGLAGWFTVNFTGALARSVSVMTTSSGDEVWLVGAVADAGNAADGTPNRFICRWPLYETVKPKMDLLRTMNSTILAKQGTMAVNAATKVATASFALFSPGIAGVKGMEFGFGGGEPFSGWKFVSRITDYTANVEWVGEGSAVDVAATTNWGWSTAIIQFGFWNVLGVVAYPICSPTDQVVVVYGSDGTLAVLPWGAGAAVLDNETDGAAVAVKWWVDYALATATYTVGLAFTATAETLSMEGGNPAGSAQGMNIHRADVTLRLTDSCLPKANGATVEPSTNRFAGAFADPLLYLRVAGDRFTDDATAKPQSRSIGGIVTITQELPWRTEVCAIFGNVQMSKV